MVAESVILSDKYLKSLSETFEHVWKISSKYISRKTQNCILISIYHRGDKPVLMNRLPTQIFSIKCSKNINIRNS